jgi:hypothetical protein
MASPDVTKARQEMEDAAFTRDRMRTVLPRLKARLRQVQAAEYVAWWEPEFKRVEAMRDARATEMRKVYSDAVARLVDLFRRAAECDRECSRINGSAPDGEYRRLLGVELTARGVTMPREQRKASVWPRSMRSNNVIVTSASAGRAPRRSSKRWPSAIGGRDGDDVRHDVRSW